MNELSFFDSVLTKVRKRICFVLPVNAMIEIGINTICTSISSLLWGIIFYEKLQP